jgi:glycosyltransferase involved in cell wall biosynthesis
MSKFIDIKLLYHNSDKLPLVSVIIPTYNVTPWLEDALKSVFAQTEQEFELIAIDDGSTDNTYELLQHLLSNKGLNRQGQISASLIRQHNGGASSARNTGIKHARGQLLAFLDADDLWHPKLLQKALACLSDQAEVNLVFPWYRHINQQGEDTGSRGTTSQNHFSFEELFLSNPIHSCSGVVLRKSIIHQVGGFDEELKSNVDFELWLRIASVRDHSISCSCEELVDYRRREGQLTGSWRRMAENWEKVLLKTRRDFPRRLQGIEQQARAENNLYWSTLAHQEQDYSSERKLVYTAWRLAPRQHLRSNFAWMCTLSALATVLPKPAHLFLAELMSRRRLRKKH